MLGVVALVSSMLHLSARSGNTVIVQVLLEEGADKNIVDRWGHTPLHWAVVTMNHQVSEILISHGAVLSLSNPATDLCEAASKEDLSKVWPSAADLAAHPHPMPSAAGVHRCG